MWRVKRQEAEGFKQAKLTAVYGGNRPRRIQFKVDAEGIIFLLAHNAVDRHNPCRPHNPRCRNGALGLADQISDIGRVAGIGFLVIQAGGYVNALARHRINPHGNDALHLLGFANATSRQRQ